VSHAIGDPVWFCRTWPAPQPPRRATISNVYPETPGLGAEVLLDDGTYCTVYARDLAVEIRPRSVIDRLADLVP